MIKTSSVPPLESSATFSNLRKRFGKCLETFVKPLEQFWKIFGKYRRKVVGNLWKVVKNIVLVCLYNKQNNTRTLGDMEFIFSCSHSISHSFTALTRSISMWTLADKFHISARPCIILYLFPSICCCQIGHNLSGTMIKFFPLDFLVELHTIPWKN